MNWGIISGEKLKFVGFGDDKCGGERLVAVMGTRDGFPRERLFATVRAWASGDVGWYKREIGCDGGGEIGLHRWRSRKVVRDSGASECVYSWDGKARMIWERFLDLGFLCCGDLENISRFYNSYSPYSIFKPNTSNCYYLFFLS